MRYKKKTISITLDKDILEKIEKVVDYIKKVNPNAAISRSEIINEILQKHIDENVQCKQ